MALWSCIFLWQKISENRIIMSLNHDHDPFPDFQIRVQVRKSPFSCKVYLKSKWPLALDWQRSPFSDLISDLTLGKKNTLFFFPIVFRGAQDEEPREKGGEKGKGGKGKGRGKGSKGKDVTWPIGPVGCCGGFIFFQVMCQWSYFILGWFPRWVWLVHSFWVGRLLKFIWFYQL